MPVHYLSDTLDAVVEDVLLGVPSFSFAFPQAQMGLVQFEQLGMYLLDFRSQKICPVGRNLDTSWDFLR